METVAYAKEIFLLVKEIDAQALVIFLEAKVTAVGANKIFCRVKVVDLQAKVIFWEAKEAGAYVKDIF